VTFALTYFDREVRVRDLDRAEVQRFVDWLTTQPGREGRLRDRSIANSHRGPSPRSNSQDLWIGVSRDLLITTL